MKNRVMIFLLFVICILSCLFTAVFAATSKYDEWKWGTSNNKGVTDGTVTVEKKAHWTNEKRTEAEIEINITSKPKSTQDITGADVLFIVDDSISISDKVNLTRADILEKVKDSMIKLLENGNDNRVAFAEFSTKLFLYSPNANGGFYEIDIKPPDGNKNGDPLFDRYKNNDEYGRYKAGELYTNGGEDFDIFNDVMKRKTIAATSSAYNLYSDVDKVTNMINNAIKRNGIKRNTDFNFPLLWARNLLESRNKNSIDRNRKLYVVIITDGQPFPYSLENRKYWGDPNSPEQHSGPESQLLANQHVQEACEWLMDNDAEIFPMIINTEGTTYSFWKDAINEDGSNGNTEHIITIKNISNDSELVSGVNTFLKVIEEKLKSPSSSDSFNGVLTDMINIDLFDIDETRKHSCDVGNIEISNDGTYIKWYPDSKMKYGDSVQIKIAIKLNARNENRVGNDFYTNAVNPDNQCVLTYDDNSFVEVPSPALERIGKTVTIRYVDEDTMEDIFSDVDQKSCGYGLERLENSIFYYQDYYYEDLTPYFGAELSEYSRTGKVRINGKKHNKDYFINKSPNWPDELVLSDNYEVLFYYKMPTSYTCTIEYHDIDTKKIINSVCWHRFRIKEGEQLNDYLRTNLRTNSYLDYYYENLNYYYYGTFGYVRANAIRIEGPGYDKDFTKSYPTDITMNGTYKIIMYYKKPPRPQNYNYYVFAYFRNQSGCAQYNVKGNPYRGEGRKNEYVAIDIYDIFPSTTIKDTYSGFFIEDELIEMLIPNVNIPEELDNRENFEVELNCDKYIYLIYEGLKVEFRFVNENDEEISDAEIHNSVQYGVQITPWKVPETIEKDGITYQNPERDDKPGLDLYVATDPITESTIIYIRYETANLFNCYVMPYLITQGLYVYNSSSAGVIANNEPGSIVSIEKSRYNIPNSDYIGYTIKDEEIKGAVDEDSLGKLLTPVESFNVTMDSDRYVYLIFIIRPTITVELDPPDTSQIPDNPLEEYEEYENDIIILDDIFGIKVEINNFAAAENESSLRVSFPFDVYYDNKFMPAGKEFELGKKGSGLVDNKEYNFRLPSWTIEKPYGEDTVVTLYGKSNNIYHKQKVKIAVMGKIYDFNITNLVGDTIWNESLFGNKIGEKEYKADTLPIGQRTVTSNVSTLPTNKVIETQNKSYKYGISLGSKFLFNINTKGLKTNKIQITPKLVYYDKDGNLDESVRYEYVDAQKKVHEFADSDGLIKENAVGSGLTASLTYLYRQTLEEKNEISKAQKICALSDRLATSDKEQYANIINQYKKFVVDKVANKDISIGGFNKITIPNKLRLPYAYYLSTENYKRAEVHRIGNTFINDDYSDISKVQPDTLPYNGYNSGISNVGMSQEAVINSLGHWYAEYYLPNTFRVVTTGLTGKVVLNSGYVVVLFKIEALDANNRVYLNYGKQWEKENNTLKEDINNGEATVNLPMTQKNSTGKTVMIDVTNGYYPVAVYDVGRRLEKGISINN